MEDFASMEIELLEKKKIQKRIKVAYSAVNAIVGNVRIGPHLKKFTFWSKVRGQCRQRKQCYPRLSLLEGNFSSN